MVKGLKLALVAIIALASWVVYATTPQPDWVFGIAWFTWDPSIAKKATPIAIGDFIGRSIGGVSGIFYYAQKYTESIIVTIPCPN